MLTYELKKQPGLPLYESLYRCIREDILSGKLAAGTKLPSKRALCSHLRVSKITVENAYSQLLQEGYLTSREKVGYFVEDTERPAPAPTFSPKPREEAPEGVDLTANGSADFPFSVWMRLQRQVMLDMGEKLLLPLPNQGLWELRREIARHLAEFRLMPADPENILIAAGTDILYTLLVPLLGRDRLYAVEEPGYDKIRKIYTACGAICRDVPMDGQGVCPEALGDADVLHISPTHHFPTGIVTPKARRQALLQWAREKDDRYIIEDDYDSEFRFDAHRMPTMAAMDGAGRVIYVNTFSKTLSPSIRISYMVLPEGLMKQFREKLGFYSCTVSSSQQYTLARFLEQGHFEKHINRMRRFYRTKRDQVLTAIRDCSAHITIREENAGLHFLVQVDTPLSEEELVERCSRAGLRVRTLSSYYHGAVPEKDRNCLVVNYSGITEQKLIQLRTALKAYNSL